MNLGHKCWTFCSLVKSIWLCCRFVTSQSQPIHMLKVAPSVCVRHENPSPERLWVKCKAFLPQNTWLGLGTKNMRLGWGRDQWCLVSNATISELPCVEVKGTSTNSQSHFYAHEDLLAGCFKPVQVGLHLRCIKAAGSKSKLQYLISWEWSWACSPVNEKSRLQYTLMWFFQKPIWLIYSIRWNIPQTGE